MTSMVKKRPTSAPTRMARHSLRIPLASGTSGLGGSHSSSNSSGPTSSRRDASLPCRVATAIAFLIRPVESDRADFCLLLCGGLLIGSHQLAGADDVPLHRPFEIGLGRCR